MDEKPMKDTDEWDLDDKMGQAQKFFVLWWAMAGRNLERRVGHEVSKEEMASYAFDGGFLAGYHAGKHGARCPEIDHTK